jgi:hypothetical protein
MNRHFGWAMLVAAGVVLGAALGSYERTPAAAQAQDAEVVDRRADVVEQLKDIKTQVKEINAVLHSGNLRVVVVINPAKP